MDIFDYKIASAGLLFVAAFVGGVLPLRFSKVNTGLLHMGNAFAGGVLLSTAIVHMLAAAQLKLEPLGLSISMACGGSKTFPVGQVFCVAGILLMLVAQVLIQEALEERPPDQVLDASGQRQVREDANYSNVKMAEASFCSPQGDKMSLCKPLLNSENRLPDASPSNHAASVPSAMCASCGGKGQFVKRDEHGCMTLADCPQCGGTGKIANTVVTFSTDYEANSAVHVPTVSQAVTSGTMHPEQNRPGTPSSRLAEPRPSGEREHMPQSRGHSAQDIAGLATLVALSLHSVLEGLAAGAAQNAAQAFSIVSAIACHKGFAAFALSSVMLPLGKAYPDARINLWFVTVIWFALASPLAVLVGALVEQNLDAVSVAVVICMASGTLAFVGISEMLIPALSKTSPGNRLVKLSLAVVGTAAMSALAIFV